MDPESFDPRSENRNRKIRIRNTACNNGTLQAGGGLGYDDLNELMKSPEDLEFILELLTVEQEYEKAGVIADP